MIITSEFRQQLRIPYALRLVPETSFATLLPCANRPAAGDIAVAAIEQIGKNTSLELANGRRCTLQEGNLIAVVFGNRYATLQFEGYARIEAGCCDLLSMGGLCGMVQSKHASVADPTRLRILGMVADQSRRPLRLQDFRLPTAATSGRPQVLVVCGTSMDAGKTYTATSLIRGLRRRGYSVAGIKLTGTAAGRDTWGMLDAGACVALDFVDAGWPSTYLCTVQELLSAYALLASHAAHNGAHWIVLEIADGLLQRETAALLQSSRFVSSVDSWVFAAGEPLSAVSGVALLRSWGIELAAVSGVVSMSALAIREVQTATQVPCLTAGELEDAPLHEIPQRPGSGVVEDLQSCLVSQV